MTIAFHSGALARLLLGLVLMSNLHGADPVRASITSKPERLDAPELALKDGRGTTIDLRSFRGRVVLVDFWATWCGGCKEELPWFQDFARKYGRKGFSVLAVSVDEGGWPAVKRFIEPLNLKLQVVLDDTDTSSRYGLKELPAAFLVDRDGRVAAKYLGLVGRANLESNIRGLLAERRQKK